MSRADYSNIGKPISPNDDFQFARYYIKEIIFPIVLMFRAVAEFIDGQMISRESRSTIDFGR